MRVRLMLKALSLCILIGCLMSIEVGEANPFIFNKIIDPVEGTIPPEITISSLRNQSTYSDIINVNLHVDKPKLNSSWASITSVYYTLDSNKKVEVYYCLANGMKTKGVQEYDTAFNLFFLSAGNHNLTIEANGVVMPNGEGLSSDLFWISNSSTITFNIGNQPFLMTTIVLIILVLTGSFLLVYFKRRRGKP
jgi:hypothetical protein